MLSSLRQAARKESVILAAGPVLGAGVGALTNVITDSWNWWLFGSLIVLIGAAAATAAYLPGISGGSSSGTVCTLPPVDPVFVGRDGEMERIAGVVPSSPHRAAVCLISGMPGSGKTVLAVRIAHRLADRYPDGQLFLEYRSHAGEAARLDLHGVAVNALLALVPDRYRSTLEGDQLIGAWRGETSGKRLLVVLDDVVRAEQILELIPASGECLVIVTARTSLPEVAADLEIRLEGLAPPDAERMIEAILGRERVSAEADIVRSLATLYRLPLAIRHAAAQVTGREIPRGERDRPDAALALFRASVAVLPERERLVLRRVALYPGAVITVFAAKALTDLPEDEVEEAMTALTRQELLTGSGNAFGMHDLVRAVALESPDEARGAALARLFVSTARLLARLRALIHAPAPSVRSDPDDQALHDMSEAEALAWATANLGDVLAVIRLAIDEGWPRTWRLTGEVSYFLRVHRNIAEAQECNDAALQVALLERDRLGAAVCHWQLGVLARVRSDYPAAERHVEAALEIFDAEQDSVGRANCHGELATINHHQGDYAAARSHAARAAELFGETGNRRGAAESEGLLGMVERLTGRYDEATAHLDRALDLFTRLGNDRSRAWISIELGTVRRQTGDLAAARELFSTARRISVQAEDRNGVAWADRELGIARRMAGELPQARRLLTSALETFTELGGRRNMADAHIELCTLHRLMDDPDTARRHGDAAISIYRDIGNKRGTAWAELELGVLDRASGDREGARSRFASALAAYLQIDDYSGKARAHDELAELAASEGDRATAERHWREALDGYRRTRSPEAARVAAILEP